MNLFRFRQFSAYADIELTHEASFAGLLVALAAT
jgi:hypothetical protein